MDEATVPNVGGGIKPSTPKPSTPPPAGGGAPPPAAPAGQAPPASGGTGKAPAVINKKIPDSPFHSGLEDKIPPLDLTPLEELKTKVTPEYCLEHAARVLEQLSEKQEDPAWNQQYIVLADQWKAMAEMLINYKIQIHQLQGDQQLKQQEMYFARDLHAQQLAMNDQQHLQKMTQSDQQHQQSMKQADAQHTIQKQQMQDQHKVNLDVTKKKGALTLQQQKDKAVAAKKAQAVTKAAPKPGGPSAKPKA